MSVMFFPKWVLVGIFLSIILYYFSTTHQAKIGPLAKNKRYALWVEGESSEDEVVLSEVYFAQGARPGQDEGVKAIDKTPPEIRNVTINSIEEGVFNHAIIHWVTDEPATSRVEFGKAKPYTHYEQDPSLKKEHKIAIYPLEFTETYYFRVLSRDESGNLGISGDYPLIAGPSDTNEPLQLLSFELIEKEPDSLTIQWQTNKFSRAELKYWPKQNDYEETEKISRDTLTMINTLKIQDLKPDTVYLLKLIVFSKGERKETDPLEVKNLPDLSPPRIVKLGVIQWERDNTIIHCVTDEETRIGIWFGLSPPTGSISYTWDNKWTTDRKIHLSLSRSDTNYFYQVKARDRYGNESISPILDLWSVPTKGGLFFRGVSLHWEEDILVINWETDKPSRGRLLYQEEESYKKAQVERGEKSIHGGGLRKGFALEVDACSNITCHNFQALGASHPINVPIPSRMSKPKDLPLTEGLLTCITCHFAHGGENRSLIRVADKDKLCLSCHTDL